jgi:hypothetical protein
MSDKRKKEITEEYGKLCQIIGHLVYNLSVLNRQIDEAKAKIVELDKEMLTLEVPKEQSNVETQSPDSKL